MRVSNTHGTLLRTPGALLRRATLALAGVALAGGAAAAEAPLAKGQAPGWYRMKVGDFEVTALSDGTLQMPADQLLHAPADKVRRALAKAFQTIPVETSVNAFVVNTGAKLVLIDSGASNLFGPTLGKVIANLRASGYKPEQIDEIYITHMHPDHVGGLAAGDKPVFPNAVVRAAKAEADFWLSPATLEKVPAEVKPMVQGAMASLKPYVSRGKFKPFTGDVQLVPGIRAQAAPGHTPGHSFYVVESKGEKLVFWGDIMHVAAVQLADPSVTIQYDSDPKAAAPQRKKAYADAAAKGYYVAVAHVAFPGIGHVRADGRAYAWVPTSYTANAEAAPASSPARH